VLGRADDHELVLIKDIRDDAVRVAGEGDEPCIRPPGFHVLIDPLGALVFHEDADLGVLLLEPLQFGGQVVQADAVNGAVLIHREKKTTNPFSPLLPLKSEKKTTNSFSPLLPSHIEKSKQHPDSHYQKDPQ